MGEKREVHNKMGEKREVHNKIDEMRAQPRLQAESFNMPYMDEVDPQNPYGPNYERLTHSAKKYYKLLKVKQYVHMHPDDSNLMRLGDVLLYGGLALGLAAGLLLAKAAQGVMRKKGYQTILRWTQKNPQLYFGLLGGGCATETYWQIGRQYGCWVVDPLYDKYLQEAITNGFQDYEISQDLGYGAVSPEAFLKQ